MDQQDKVSRQLDLAEAELAVLRQEQVLRDLLATGEPTADVVARLDRLRKVVESITAANTPKMGSDGRR